MSEFRIGMFGDIELDLLSQGVPAGMNTLLKLTLIEPILLTVRRKASLHLRER